MKRLKEILSDRELQVSLFLVIFWLIAIILFIYIALHMPDNA